MKIDHPIPDGECWFRVITNTKHVNSDNTLNLQFLKGSAFKSSNAKPWQHELSGRLVSLAGTAEDIILNAHTRVNLTMDAARLRGDKVPSYIRFVGLAASSTEALRKALPSGSADVVYTPLPDDKAHSDFVTFNTFSDADLAEVRSFLIGMVKLVYPAEITDSASLCR